MAGAVSGGPDAPSATADVSGVRGDKQDETRLTQIVALYTPGHINYALFHEHPIPAEAMYHNPWPPRRVLNSPLSAY